MNQLVACLIFNIVGFGGSFFLSIFDRKKVLTETPGTTLFWGFLTSMLLVYTLWLFIPYHLDIACYIIFCLSLLAIFFLFRKEGFKTFLKTHYLTALLTILPFVYIVSYSPIAWDEFSYWLFGAKVFYIDNSLFSPDTQLNTLRYYTPLWTLQAAFFHFFSLSSFSESIVYAVRINIFLAFVYYIKEVSGLRFFSMIIWTYFLLLLFYNYYFMYTATLMSELPIFILLTSFVFLVGNIEKNGIKDDKYNAIILFFGTLCAYLIKKSLLAVFPAALFIFWRNKYKRHFYFMGLFLLLIYFSWELMHPKLQTVSVNYDAIMHRFSLHRTKEVLRLLMIQSFQMWPFFLAFLLSMGSIFWKNKNVFWFHVVFSIFYFLGLLHVYFSFFSEYEALNLASYDRYLGAIFIPAYMYAFYIFLFELQNRIKLRDSLTKYLSKFKIVGAICLGGMIGGYFYYTTFSTEFAFMQDLYSKINNLYRKVDTISAVEEKRCLAVWQGGNDIQRFILSYIGHGELKSLDSGSYGTSKDNIWRTAIDDENKFIIDIKKNYDFILVFESDDWMNKQILKLTNINTEGLKFFGLVNTKDGYQLVGGNK